MKDLQAPILTDTWVTASWDEYIQLVSNSIYDKAKCYYHQGQLRIEMPPVGHDHSSDNTVISFGVPDLVIEVGDTSISDDLNRKKQLYEELKISEYWAVNVAKAKLSAFAINEGSQLITESRVLPGLLMSLLEQALRRSWSFDQTEVGAWLLQEFQTL